MLNVIDLYDESFFIPVLWKDVKDGQEVYLKGTQLGVFRAYGPHFVYDKKTKSLVNRKGVIFLQYPEVLLFVGQV